ncbi:MAG: AAA family ATPase [Lachnospiraceae bacterium]|nr:AAA family ATPase [Lachnospiraceae bacterium]
MNINEAKEYIKNSITMYLKKDEFGDYRIPVVRQRPIFLLGAPGIGKTAIMEQIASELGIALVSYSMTHHTRQSALGLPFIKQKEYGGRTYDVSEYTMSEIIASVYETMEESGVKEGILFLDEINCVSETLAPSMLQFLQYKVFGKHRVPDGWVIVTAGNPPQYNKSVREFDVVTLDRLKVLNVEADVKTWKKYAKERGIHAAILGFLNAKEEYFYHMETTAEGKSYVTARGWEDLSEVIKMSEEEGLEVNENLIGQYIRNDEIVKEFETYYQLYNKYRNDYRVDALLEGEISEAMLAKANKASFDERLSLLGMLIDKVQGEMREVCETEKYLRELLPGLKAMKECADIADMIDKQILAKETFVEKQVRAGALDSADKRKFKRIIRFLNEASRLLPLDFEAVRGKYNAELASLKEETQVVKKHIANLFSFTSAAFGDDSNEMLVLVTELTVDKSSSAFLSTYGSEEYEKYNKLLMVSDRGDKLKEKVASLIPQGL